MSSFVTKTRHEIEPTYSMDNFFPTSNYSSPTQQYTEHKVLTSSPTSQSNPMTYDCLPQQGTTSAVSTIPLENLSIHHAMSHEWMSPLGLGYSEYNQPDMNFLFTYNELVIANKDMSKIGFSSETSSPMTHHRIGHKQQSPTEGEAEQYRRFSMMDISRPSPTTTESPFISSQPKLVGSSPYLDFHPSLFQQPQQVNTCLQKENRLNDVFAPQHPTLTNHDYLQEQQQKQQQQQQQHLQHKHQQQQQSRQQQNIQQQTHQHQSHQLQNHQQKNHQQQNHQQQNQQQQQQQQQQEQQGQTGMSWHQHGLLSRRPLSTTPIKEEEDILNQDLAKYYRVQTSYIPSCTEFNHTNVLSSSTSSPLKKHAKRSSIMMDGIDYSIPSVVPSQSEPIPSNWMTRKRTKSIREDMVQEEDYLQDSVPSHVEENQVLAAMPRRQKLRYEGDHYTPKWVRYTGHLKEGYCDSCQPGKWLQLKNSAYWYHKQFYHGISSVSGKSFMKPLEQRMGKGDMIEGLCHQCHRFVPACNGKKKNNYMLWYRHAHKCHLYDKPKATLKTMRKLSITTTTTATTIPK